MRLGAKIFSVVGAVLSLLALIQSIGLTKNMAAGQLSQEEIAHYLAFTTCVITLSVLIGKIAGGQAGYQDRALRQNRLGYMNSKDVRVKSTWVSRKIY